MTSNIDPLGIESRTAADEATGMTPNEMRRRWPANVAFIETEARADDKATWSEAYHKGYEAGRAAALREAVCAIRREDLCDATDGEHHTDEYVAAFLAAIDALRENEAQVTVHFMEGFEPVIRSGDEGPEVEPEVPEVRS